MSVYFIQAGEDGPVKVGYTNGSVATRLSALQIGSHSDLRLLAVLRETQSYERYLHGIHRGQHIRGEWFRREGQFANYLRQVAIPLSEPLPTIRASQPVGRRPKLTPEQWIQIESLLLSPRAKPLSIGRIAHRFRVSASLVHLHFPAWRSKTAAERKAFRRANPLPSNY